VNAITFEDASAYCSWRSLETGHRCRLPTEEEWEKAARGVDGRVFPWGSLEDASLAKCRLSREVNPQLEPVGSFPHAVSIYGMNDAVGGVWHWTESWYDQHRTSHVLRGGAWNTPPDAMRCHVRGRGTGAQRTFSLGFRCAHDLEGAGA
jgi:formylglycine-generating enzyme required for sulfatase activity